MNTTSAYIPGVCNINHAEIKRRRAAGHLGLALYVVLLAVLIFAPVSPYFGIILIVPAMLAAIGYLQAKNKFCVGYAGAGLQNSDDGSTTASAVSADNAATDKKRAKSINRQAVLFGFVFGLVPVIVLALTV